MQIKKWIYVARTGYYNCCCVFIYGSRLVRSGRTDYFRQKLLAERGCRAQIAAESRRGRAVVFVRLRPVWAATSGCRKKQGSQWIIPGWTSSQVKPSIDRTPECTNRHPNENRKRATMTAKQLRVSRQSIAIAAALTV